MREASGFVSATQEKRAHPSEIASTAVIPPPERLPGFPDAVRVRRKGSYAGGLRQRWQDPRGRIYEWDYQHGTVEIYDARGRHQGEFDPHTGQTVGPRERGRRVEP